MTVEPMPFWARKRETLPAFWKKPGNECRVLRDTTAVAVTSGSSSVGIGQRPVNERCTISGRSGRRTRLASHGRSDVAAPIARSRALSELIGSAAHASAHFYSAAVPGRRVGFRGRGRLFGLAHGMSSKPPSLAATEIANPFRLVSIFGIGRFLPMRGRSAILRDAGWLPRKKRPRHEGRGEGEVVAIRQRGSHAYKSSE